MASSGKAPANVAASSGYELPWFVIRLLDDFCELRIGRVEKYRPQSLDDVVGNIDTIERLKVIAKDGNCPHIIISVRFYTIESPFLMQMPL